MKVLHVVHGFPPEYVGGTECYVQRLAEVQRAGGHDVCVLTGTHVTADRAWIEPTEIDGLPVYRLHRRGLCGDRWDRTDSPEAEGRARALLRRLAPDVVHLHHWVRLSRGLARIAARAGLPVVWTLHDLSVTCPRFNRVLDDGTLCDRPLDVAHCLGCAPASAWQHPEELAVEIDCYRADLRAELEAAARLVVPSRAQADRLASHLGGSPARFAVLAHGSLHSIPRPGDTVPDPDGRLRLVHWGYWYRDKGIHVLLEALEHLDDALRARVHLSLYGQAVFPEYGREIEARAAALPVDLAGPFQPERLPGERFDLAVLPSLAHESYSFVLDEAFQLGLPVIASRIGALAERVARAGRLFTPGDSTALAACIREAVEHPDRLAAWRAAVPATVPTLEQQALALAGIYEEAQDAGPPGTAPPPPPRSTERRLRERCVANRELEIARLEGELRAREDEARASPSSG